jgi:glycosyltransferase involved in cell wall biosynthesis
MSTPFIDRSARPEHPSVTVVIPTKNEAQNLRFVLPLLPSGIDELIIVDADSTDGTPDVARELRPDAKVICQQGRGKGSALSAGFAAASGDIVVMLDADGSMDPREIPGYVGLLRAGADLVKGSRFCAGAHSDDITPLRMAGNWGLRLLANLLFKQRWTELAYGYAAMWTDILAPLGIDRLDTPHRQGPLRYGHGFEIETLMFTRTAAAGLRVVEAPSVEFERVHGVTNLRTFPDGSRVLVSLLRERLRPVRVRTTVQHRRPDLESRTEV